MTVFVGARSNTQAVYNVLYLTALMGFIICKQEILGSFSPNVTRPERGSGIRLTCSLSAVSKQLILYNYNILQNLSLTHCRLDLKGCIPEFYGEWPNPVYTFGATTDTAWVDIISLNRTRDQGLWHCNEFQDVQNNETLNETLKLTVYSSPGGVSLVTYLPPVVELAEISIMLECKTNRCGYPEPFIAWYYQEDPNPISLSTGTISRSNGTESCIQQEHIYYSSLELSRGTNFPGNIPMTVNLLCGVTHPSLNGTEFSVTSISVIFAVSLMFVNISGETDVTQGVPANFTCITSISRPRATVTWFIGTAEVKSGIQNTNSTDGSGSPFVESRLTINPNSMIHHGKEIFCQALTPFNNVTSAELILYVRVSLMFVNISGETDVTQGVQANFTCITSISRPHAAVIWFIGITEVTSGIQNINSTDSNGSSFVQSKLSISPDSTIHHGKYIFCQAFTPFDRTTSDNLTLFVRVYVTNVTLNSAESVITFLDGDEKMLSCTSSAGRPQPMIQWWLNGVVQTSGSTDKPSVVGNLHVTTSEMYLTLNRTYQDKHIYCDAHVAGQPYVVNSTKITANIWYPPSMPLVKPFSIDFPWLENRTGILECVTADPGNPRASVIWMNLRGTMDNDEHLVISNLTAQDNQKAVTCKLQNNFTEAKGMNLVSTTVNINVEYTPIITLNPAEQQKVKETSPLRINCTGTGNPTPTVEWLNGSSSNNILYFPNIRRNNTGSYTCKASSNSTNYGSIPLHREKSIVVIVELSDKFPGPGNEFPVAAVAGSIGAAVIVITAVAVALIVLKRRTPRHKGKDCGAEEMEECRGKRQDRGLVDNPVYATSGLAPSTSIGSAGGEYAAVVKAKTSAVPVEDPSNLYAQVDKAKYKKLKKGDTSANAKLGEKRSSENVYENSGYVGVGTSGKNVNENPGDSASNGPLAFKDDLQYADLMLDPPTTLNGKPVIRGLDNRTEYAEIAYGLRGEPLPDNDEEKENNSNQ